MKNKLKLKSYVLPTLYVLLFIATFYITLVVSNSLSKSIIKDESDDTNYVNESIIEEDRPVINEDESTNTNKIIKPYTNNQVSIGKYFYDYKASDDKQKNSIIYHDNTYMQNSGVDYILEEAFDVVSVMDGVVSLVKEDDLLGKIVEIKHDNNYVSVYQSLSSINVAKGDKVSQGDVIGKSGTNELDKDMGNHLHFELYVNGGVVDPTLYIDKDLENNNSDNNKTDKENSEDNSNASSNQSTN